MSSYSSRLVATFTVLAVVLGLITLSQSSPSDSTSTSPPAGASDPGPRVSEASDTGAAVLAAHRQGSRVEVADQRTSTRTVFANPDGDLTAELAAVPVRVKRDDGWAAVDTALAPGRDGTIAPKAVIGDLALSGGGSSAPLARLVKDGKALELHWQGALPKPVLAGNEATYPEVLPGVDLVMRAEANGYRQRLVIKSAEAARNPALAKIRFSVAADGMRLTVDGSGSVKAADDAGQPVFVAPPSQMWDSSGPAPSDPATSRSASVGVEVGDGMLTLLPDLRFLADPATAFPVVVDPDWKTFEKWGWATTLSGKASQAYWWTSGDPNGRAQVGRCYEDGTCNGIGIAWAYFQYDTSFLAGKQIISATFDTAVVSSPNCEGRAHELYMADRGIDSGTTWNNRPQGWWVAEQTVPGVWQNCPGFKPVGFAVAGNVNATGMSTYFLKAKDDNQISWRKYDPGATVLRVNFNQRPNPPANLRTDPPMPAPCRWCDGRPFIGDANIRLLAQLSDPDNEAVNPQWHIYTNGVREERGWWGLPFQTSGATHDTNVDLASRDGATVDWYVHAGDGHDSGDWGRGPGPFVVDRVGVGVEPTVSGALYREDNAWHGGVGVADTFTFGANNVADIDHYLYGWNDPPSTTVDATALGGGAAVSLAPLGDGPRTLYVQSVDRAGHRSPTKAYRFYVRAGNGALAQWAFEGNANDDAFLGDRDGTLHGNASYAPGAVGTALLLDGSAGTDMTAPNTVRTDTSFSVSAWVKPDTLPGRVMGVVSQDGNQAGGFYLNYSSDNNKWNFILAGADADNPSTYGAVSPDAPQSGVWTHLAGVYDRAANKIRIYVNGVLAAETALPANFTPWHAGGALVVGREKRNGILAYPWKGAIDEVAVHDRVTSDAEIKATVTRDNVHVGHWKFDEADGTTTARNSVDGGDHGVLTNGAAFTDRGAVKRAVQLDGIDDHLVTGGPAVRTDQSFSVATWVRADRFVTGGAAMTAVSQDGNRNSGFYLQYNSAIQKWVFLKFTTDDDSPAWIGVQASQQPQLNHWVHLAGVFDGTTRQLRVYVNGELGGSATLPDAPWQATGPLAIGRSKFAGNLVEYWPGAIDEVRLYSRVLAVEELQGIVSQNDVPAASWKLDGGVVDDAGAVAGALGGGPAWTAGQAANPDPADLAISLDGVDDHLRTPPVVDSDQSFSAAAWVRLNNRPAGWAAVMSQNGTHTAAFNVGYSGGNDHWAFAMHGHDTPEPPSATRVYSAESAQIGVWTHLAVVYHSGTGEMRLYVNGALSATGQFTAHWNAAGEFDVGRALWADRWRDYLPGAVDDVKVYSRPLFAEEIRVMAGRDLTLVHNWQLDEGSGTNAADSVGARGGTLTGGAGYGPGRVGNAVRLDGVDDAVSTAGIDLRTDRSFAVAAWVYLNPVGECQDACKVDAVTIDSGQTSKLRLGHVVDNDQNPRGKWIFEMPESNGTVTEAAVSVDTADLKAWVHLVGVYDEPTRKIWLYVNRNRIDDGTLNTPWQATGGLQIGRGNRGGAPAEFWPGSVDDVRLYTGALDKDRITALYSSYPAPAGSATLPVADAGYWKFDENTGTSAADSSDRGRTATMKGGAGWIGGRGGASSWLDGTAGYAESDGPVLDTSRSFSVSAFAYLTKGTGGNRTVVGQDGSQASAFRIQYNESAGKWAVVVPTADQRTSVVLTSAELATVGLWAQLAVVYDANLRQLRLYVNGMLSAVQVGVSTWSSTGPMSIGRGRWNGGNVEFFPGGVDEVQAFGRPLSDGEVRRVHDDAITVLHGRWGFDGAADDTSWRHNPTTLSGGASFVQGVRGQAVQLDGTSGSATTQLLGANPIDSFTVSAWAKLTGTDHDSTILGQDGSRMSGFVLQYNKNVGRWVFGAPTQDADFAQLVYAYSARPPVLNTWTHLTGVYDYAARQLRLYVNGELVGTRNNAPLWPAWGGFTIGRGKYNGAPAGFFAGMLDEVQTDLGIATEEDIRRRGGYPAPAGGQLGRFINAEGDHYTANSTGSHSAQFSPVPAGYRFEGPMGKLLAGQQPNTKLLYACLSGTDEFTSAEANCEGMTKLGELGWIYTQQPATVPTIALYRCLFGQDHFESLSSGCEGKTNDGLLLGYTVAYAALARYVHPLDGEHTSTVHGVPPSYRYEGTHGLLSMIDQPGTQPLWSCREGLDEFVSLDSTCEGKTVLASLGRAWIQPPSGVASTPIYRCSLAGGERFVSNSPDCEGNTAGQLLGHALAAVPASPAVPSGK